MFDENTSACRSASSTSARPPSTTLPSMGTTRIAARMSRYTGCGHRAIAGSIWLNGSSSGAASSTGSAVSLIPGDATTV